MLFKASKKKIMKDLISLDSEDNPNQYKMKCKELFQHYKNKYKKADSDTLKKLEETLSNNKLKSFTELVEEIDAKDETLKKVNLLEKDIEEMKAELQQMYSILNKMNIDLQNNIKYLKNVVRATTKKNRGSTTIVQKLN